jgi:Sensors of blue-light using FAD
MLERLVYQSQATHSLGSLHLFNLLAVSRKKNERLGITGHLLYTEETFVQCIEGPSESIESLWQSLQRDQRHHSLEILVRHPQVERRFPSWTMAFSSYRSFNQYEMQGFFPVDKDGMTEATRICIAP